MTDTMTATTVEFGMPTLHRPLGAALSCPRPAYVGIAGWRIAPQGQDVDIADRGGNVAKKFSTRQGPPSCSWPV